jgi:hypothetical protein
MKIMRSGGVAPRNLNLCTKFGDIHAQAVLLLGKESGVYFAQWLGGPRSRSGSCGEQK